MSYTDSPSKKLVRLNVLECAMNVIGHDRFLTGRHLGLASREAGDLSVLAGLGVTGPCVMAEHDRDAWIDAMVRWRWADIRNQDIFEVAKSERPFVHINFDSCSPIRMEAIPQLSDLVDMSLEPGGVITTWFLAGREHSDVMLDVDAMANLLRSAEIFPSLLSHYPEDVLVDRLPYIARALTLEQTLDTHLHAKTGKHLRLVRIWTYTSTDYDAGKSGSPMVVVQMKLSSRGMCDLTNSVLAAIRHSHFMVVGDTRKRLGAKAMELMSHGRDAGLLLNSPKSVPAWRAHATRGSYGS